MQSKDPAQPRGGPGIHVANSAIRKNSAAMAPKLTGSVGLVPTSMLVIPRVKSSAACQSRRDPRGAQPQP
jgi:hypothetical protein